MRLALAAGCSLKNLRCIALRQAAGQAIMLRELPLEPFLLHVLGCVCMQIDKILLEVAGETLSQMAAAPKQQKQVRAGTWRPKRAAPGWQALCSVRRLCDHCVFPLPSCLAGGAAESGSGSRGGRRNGGPAGADGGNSKLNRQICCCCLYCSFPTLMLHSSLLNYACSFPHSSLHGHAMLRLITHAPCPRLCTVAPP